MARAAGNQLPELLAPAGDATCLRAAIKAGADAVYFGVDALNMRAAAQNFGSADIAGVAAQCHAAGVRCYLTLNTIVFSHEESLVRSILSAALGHVDAVICWDPSVIALCRELGHVIHVSTQASVANVAAARFYRDLGAERIVPARECTLEEVCRIRAETGIEIEAFVHGAMCVNLSGRCFLSQDIFNKSGNRGACLQPCRREYTITELEEGEQLVVGSGYVLSAKDLCTIPFLDVLIEAGLDAFKIEGRNRNPEYVDTVVRCYRRALDAHAAGALTPTLKETLVADLRKVYNRTFSDGFYFGRPIAEFCTGRNSQATHRKEGVGKVINYYKQAGVAEIEVTSNTFAVGDELMIQGPTTGVVISRVAEIRCEEESVPRALRGRVTVKVTQRVRAGDSVYLRVLRQGRRAGEE